MALPSKSDWEQIKKEKEQNRLEEKKTELERAIQNGKSSIRIDFERDIEPLTKLMTSAGYVCECRKLHRFAWRIYWS